LAVVADDVRHADAAGADERGNASISGIPGFDGNPGVHFAVVVDNLTFVVDHDAGIPRLTERVLLHDGETAPYLVGDAGGLEGGDFGAGEGAHYVRGGGHAEAMDAVFREDDEIHQGVAAAGFGDEGDDVGGCIGELGGSLNVEELRLADTDDDGIWRGLVEAA
jgi:hypothetical protein